MGCLQGHMQLQPIPAQGGFMLHQCASPRLEPDASAFWLTSNPKISLAADPAQIAF